MAARSDEMKIIKQNDRTITRPGEKPERSLEKVAAFNPDIMRQSAILRLMEGPATIARISREEMILEGLVFGASGLGMHLPATMSLISKVRELSPGLDGLGRGEAVKCLTTTPTTYYPSAPFGQENKPGLIARLMAFFSGKKPEAES